MPRFGRFYIGFYITLWIVLLFNLDWNLIIGRWRFVYRVWKSNDWICIWQPFRNEIVKWTWYLPCFLVGKIKLSDRRRRPLVRRDVFRAFCPHISSFFNSLIWFWDILRKWWKRATYRKLTLLWNIAEIYDDFADISKLSGKFM